VGFAAGIERLLMVLDKTGFMIPDSRVPELFIAAADEESRLWTLSAAMRLRAGGLAVETDFLGRSLKAQMREADRQRARFVVVVGSRELEQGKATLKRMSDGATIEIGLDTLALSLTTFPV
jgi:histidyl-tRNA synthetase